tara:strand:- start:129269 stop:130492 length:1224 start_codon:yes stop_codon:yes gene_type:complete
MKVAVIGGGVLGMEMARRLHEMEAAVTLFTKSGNLGGKLSRMASYEPEFLLGSASAAQYIEEKIKPLEASLRSSIPVKEAEVLRVNKRFLGPEEEVEGRTRLSDLFRVIYRVDPTELIKSQQEENPELYKNFDEQMLKSLGEELEAFEDFDMVVDASGIMENPNYLGPGGVPALNELGLSKKGKAFYGWDAVEGLRNNLDKKNIVIAGFDEAAALAVLELREWLSKGSHILTLVCEKGRPFENLSSNTQKKFETFMNAAEAGFTKKMETYREKVFAWRELDEHVKAKTPMPAEPRPPFEILLNSYITSIDCLVDQEGWFLTVENKEESLRTLKADVVLSLKGFKKSSVLSQGLQTHYNFGMTSTVNADGMHPEAGFYTLLGDDIESGISKIDPIIENMLGFFSKVEN